MPAVANRLRNLGLRLLGYDATEPKNRRKAPDGILRSEDSELTPDQRRKMLSAARDVPRNFTIAGWMIRKHLDYVSTFNFQSKTGDKALDAKVEQAVRGWSRKESCDVSGRFNLQRFIRAAEERRTVDGDLAIVKLDDGRLQGIEGDRILTPAGGFPNGRKAIEFTHGVKTDVAGKPLEFSICRRRTAGSASTDSGGFVFERIVPATNLWHHGYFTRFDQVRGVAPLAPAINVLRDLYEGFDYALAKMKVAQLFGLAIYRESDDEIGTVGEDADGGIKVDFGKGPAFFDLNREDKAEFLESNSPSQEFQSWGTTMIGAALKGLDIPFSFYSENFTNFSGQRQAWIQYDLSARCKRQDNVDLLDSMMEWALPILQDEGRVPRYDISDRPWRWLSVGVPWINPLQEVQADVQAIAAGLTSRTRVAGKRGEDIEEIFDELEREQEMLAARKLPTDVSPANSQIVEIAGNVAA